MKDLMAWVNERMKVRHMTQTELADMIDSDPQQISKWLNGHTKPRWEKMIKLVDAFGYHFEIVANDEIAKQDMDLYETAHQHGFQYGYQTAIKDMAKKMKEIRTYGGCKQAKRTERVPGVRKGPMETDKRKISDAGSYERNGRQV